MIASSKRRVIAAVVTAAAAVALAIVITGRGCDADDRTPEGATRAFVDAARGGDEQAVWDLLAPATQKRLMAAAQGATSRVGGTRRFDVFDMIEVGARESSYEPSSIVLREKQKDRAIVDVLGPSGRRDSVTLVKVGDRWRIELALDDAVRRR
jgi:hypothetical protein